MQAANATLPDGTAILLRPVRANDKRLLAAAFATLSPESRYRRFLAPHPRLSARELRYFTEVDHTSHEALVAVAPADDRAIAIARYVVDPHDPAAAEVAIAVLDDWQGRGVGTVLLQELSRRARRQGVRDFTATVLADNRLMVALLHELGAAQPIRRDAGVVEYRVRLESAATHLPVP